MNAPIPEPIRRAEGVGNTVSRCALPIVGACAVLIAGLLPTSAAFADWPQFRGDPALSGVASDVPEAALEPAWTFEAGDAIESTAAISAGSVFVASLDGTLYALKLADGSLLWKYSTEAEIKSSPSVREGLVYFGDESGIFHAVDAATGRLRWKFETDGGITSSANFTESLVLFGSYDQFLYALDRSSGELRWKVETEGYVHASPAVAGNYALVSGCDGFFRKIDLRNGTEAGKLQLGSYVASSMAVHEDFAFTGTFDNEVLAVNWKTEELVWRYSHPERTFPFYSSPAANDKIVVIGGRDKLVHALYPTSGKTRWTFSTRGRIDASPVIAGDRVYVASGSGDLLALAVADGSEIWRYDMTAPITASPAVGEGHLVLGTDDGLVVAFGAKRNRAESRSGS